LSLESSLVAGAEAVLTEVLQRAVVMLLEAVYEQDFLDCSYGFRAGRSAHQALAALWREAMDMGGGWALEIDIRKFSLAWTMAIYGRFCVSGLWRKWLQRRSNKGRMPWTRWALLERRYPLPLGFIARAYVAKP
jgi:hypothetical protein